MKRRMFGSCFAFLLLLMQFGCDRSIPSSFAVEGLKVLSRANAVEFMGSDWARRLDGVSLPDLVVCVSLVSSFDLVKYSRDMHAGVSVVLYESDTSVEKLNLICPFLYNEGLDVNQRAHAMGDVSVGNGSFYRYKVVLCTDGSVEKVRHLIENGATLSLRVKAANMGTVQTSDSILIRKL